ncbi:hypothetical protein [Wolbachia endosymbiont (group E) of Neria commutata]|uniref:hypothetical protein n=1 Tax=Wolbachia endosymbiont (group E) of Neria commutata TaxID=3066149 RepID=UPI0031329C71
MHTADYFKDLDFLGLKKLTNQPSRVFVFIKKHSLNNALPIAAVSTWFQFSLGYVAAIIITSNDLSFITAIFNPTLMSAYALVSVILGAVFLTSLALKYMNREEIKESLIDEKIRGGKPGKISKIAKEAEKIEIIIKLGSKKEFSIIIPISKTQENILDGQIEENRNRVILLTIPYVISAAVILGALIQNRFSFANVVGWQEWVYIALVSTITVVGICIAFYKLRNNEKNETHDFVKKFDNRDILFPWKKVGVASVMQERATGQNNLQSQLIEFAREFKDEFINLFASRLDMACNSFDAFLDETETLIDNFFNSVDANIEKTLDNVEENAEGTFNHIKESIVTKLNVLHGEISIVLGEAEKFLRKANSLDIEGTFSELQSAVKIAKDKIEQFQPNRLIGYFTQNTQPSEPLNEMEEVRKEVEELKTVNKELKKSLKEAKTQTTKRNSNCGTSCGSENIPNKALNAQLDEEKKAREENKFLKSKKRTEELQTGNAKLNKGLAQQKEKEKWEKTLNGPSSELFNSLLEDIKLEIIHPDGKKTEKTLREFDSEMKPVYRNAEQEICPIKGKGSYQIPPGSVINFLDPKFQAAFEKARG